MPCYIHLPVENRLSFSCPSCECAMEGMYYIIYAVYNIAFSSCCHVLMATQDTYLSLYMSPLTRRPCVLVSLGCQLGWIDKMPGVRLGKLTSGVPVTASFSEKTDSQ